MLGDAGRGWAWTRALLGLPAAEVRGSQLASRTWVNTVSGLLVQELARGRVASRAPNRVTCLTRACV
jgi:hypothetical protein